MHPAIQQQLAAERVSYLIAEAEGCRLARHADVDGCVDRADVAHELLGLLAQRPLHGGDRKQRIVRPGRLRGRDGCLGHERLHTNQAFYG